MGEPAARRVFSEHGDSKMGCHESKDKQIEHPTKDLHKDPVAPQPETTSPPAPPAAPSRGGMDGNVYGDPEKGDLPWDVMCVVFVKDLEKNKHLYRVEVKCAAGTTIAALQERVEWTLEYSGTGTSERASEIAFSQSKANITAIVPRTAPDWIDISRPDQTVGEVENEFGMSVDDLSKKEDDWKYRGEQKKGLRFYATTGEPTGEAGFAFWEVDHDGPNQPLLVSISNSLHVIADHRESQK